MTKCLPLPPSPCDNLAINHYTLPRIHDMVATIRAAQVFKGLTLREPYSKFK
jgi:hypothetical protein